MRAILAFALSVVVAVLATRTWRALSSDRAQLVHALNLLDEMEQRLEMAEEVGRRASRTTVEASNTMRGQRDLIREELEAYRREVQFELGGMQQMLDNRTKEAESLKKEVEYQASLTKKQCAGYVKKGTPPPPHCDMLTGGGGGRGGNLAGFFAHAPATQPRRSCSK